MAVSNAARKGEGRGSEIGPEGRERLGGARADFVANLGRRRAEIRSTLESLKGDPTSKRFGNELRRRFHALGAAAKLLRFSRLADEVAAAEIRLQEASLRGSLDDSDFGALTDLASRLTALAWGTEETPAPKAFASEVKPLDAARSVAEPPIAVLFVGPANQAEALLPPLGRHAPQEGPTFEVERCPDMSAGQDMARAMAPDVIVIDGDRDGAPELVAGLSDDPLTEGIPVIVLLKVQKQSDSGPFLAAGVAKVLPRPVSPGELRRSTADVVRTYVKQEVSREPLGELSVEKLGSRLAEELRRGLSDMVDPKSRETTLRFGEGTEVLAALWGAVARIRDLVTIQSQGRVRFAHGGPEGAVPIAPWMDSETHTERSRRAGKGPFGRQATGSLDKTRIVVVDDDPAVCWFLAGVLKSAGATVYEARDGERALEIAKHVVPDLIISDILMPKIDGFTLCRTIKRDILLRDVPVILLSWKEDLLQRVRELGVDADGYLKKEASASAVVQRAREVVRSRQRVATRVAEQTEVRGRLDGITPFALLRFACESRPDCTISVRDASFLYEVEIRQGQPVSATRTSLAGVFERGSSVLAALLGVGDGRFAVSQPRDAADSSLRADLEGGLMEQLTPVVAAARAAQRLLSGPTLLRVARVDIDMDSMQAYWGATPPAARNVAYAIAEGEMPRDLIAAGQYSARLLEDVLSDLASRGCVVSVMGADGEDHLPEATSQELSLLAGDRPAAPLGAVALPVFEQELAAPGTPLPLALPSASDVLKEALRVPEITVDSSMPEGSIRPPVVGMPVEPFQQAPLLAEPLLEALSQEREQELEAAWFGDPSSEEQALVESPVPSSGPRELTPPPAVHFQTTTPDSLPTPQPTKLKTPAPHAEVSADLTPTPSKRPLPPGVNQLLSLGSLHPPPVCEPPLAKARKKSPKPSEVARKDKHEEKRSQTPKPNDTTPRFPLPSAYLPRTAEAPKRDRKALYWVGFALLGVGFALWARTHRQDLSQTEATMMADVARPAVEEVSPPADATEAPAAEGTPEGESNQLPTPASTEAPPEELPLRESDKVKKGQGMLEIIAGRSDTVYIDGKPIGSGPSVTLPLRARKYEIKVKTRGDERTRFIEVKENKLVRVRLAPPWQR